MSFRRFKCPEPVALQVCQEFRRHTRINYVYISHAYTLSGSFYFNPSRDVLYLPMDVGDEDMNVDDEDCRLGPLQDSYAHQLDNVETVLIRKYSKQDSGRRASIYKQGITGMCQAKWFQLNIHAWTELLW
jgi:hypothetical protein